MTGQLLTYTLLLKRIIKNNTVSMAVVLTAQSLTLCVMQLFLGAQSQERIPVCNLFAGFSSKSVAYDHIVQYV